MTTDNDKRNCMQQSCTDNTEGVESRIYRFRKISPFLSKNCMLRCRFMLSHRLHFTCFVNLSYLGIFRLFTIHIISCTVNYFSVYGCFYYLQYLCCSFALSRAIFGCTDRRHLVASSRCSRRRHIHVHRCSGGLVER